MDGGPYNTGKDTFSRVFASTLFIVANVCLSACATDAQKKITAFADAATITTTNVGNAFETVEAKHYQAQVNALVLNYSETGYKPGSVKRFLEPKDIEARQQVLKALQVYAQKLADVMSDKQLVEFDKETKNFGATLVKLNKNTVLKESGLPDADLQILATAVNAIGRWFIEYKRAKVIGAITNLMQPEVAEICHLLAKDIGAPPTESTKGNGLRKQLWLDYDKILRDQDALLQKQADKMDFVTRRQEIKRLPEIEAEYRLADQTLKATQTALDKLTQTHAVLAQAFHTRGYELTALTKQLGDEAQRVKSFYEDLKKT